MSEVKIAKSFISAKELSEQLEISLQMGYKICRELNSILKSQGYIVVAGRTSLKFFNERFYGGINIG